MIDKITYDGNADESYNLIVDGKDVAEIRTGEDGAIQITEIVRQFFGTYKNCEIEVKNDGDKIGLIMDAYSGDVVVDSQIIYFTDFQD